MQKKFHVLFEWPHTSLVYFNKILMSFDSVFFRQFVDGRRIVPVPEVAVARHDDVRHLARRLGPPLLGHQPPSHGLQIHSRGVEIR